MLPGIFLQWVRSAVTQQVLNAARGELHAELQARMAAAGEGPRRCPVGVICGESFESETLESLLENRVCFVSDRLTIVQGFLRFGDESGDAKSSRAESVDDSSEKNTEGDQARCGVWIAVARAGQGQKAARRSVEALINGHQPQLVIAMGICTALTSELRARELLLVHQIVPDDENDDEPSRSNGAGGKKQTCETDGTGNSMQGRGTEPRNANVNAMVPVGDGAAETGMRCGTLVTVGRIAKLPQTATARRRLARRTGAVAADTMALPVVEFCRNCGTPVLVLRGVQETFHERFSSEVRRYQRRNTTTGRIGAFIGAFLDRDGAVTELQRWNRRGRAIAERLAGAVVGIVRDTMLPTGCDESSRCGE